MTEADQRARLIDRLVTIGWISSTALFVILALYVVLVGQLLSLLPERRAEVAAWVGNRLDMRVEIDRIDANMRLLTPVVHLRGVRVYVKGGPSEPALAAPVIDLEVATLSTVFARRPVLKLLRIEGIDLTIIEGEDGRFRVKGMPFNVNDPQAAERLRQALDVVYRQKDIVVARSRLSVESARLPVSALEGIRLHMYNDGTAHRVAGAATLQGAGRLPVSFVLHFDGTPVVPADLVAQLYVRVSPSSLEGWLPRRDAGDIWLDSLSGGGEAWLTIEKARVTGVTGRVQVDSVAASFQDGRKLEGLLGLGTRFRWRGDAQAGTLAFGGLSFRRQGRTWPETDGALEWRRDEAGQWRVRAMLARGSLQMLAGLADALPPEQAALAARLARVAPEGQLSGVRFRWDEAAPPAARWQLAAGFSQLALRADGALPGVNGLSGRVEMVPGAGALDVLARQSTLAAPTLFAAPLSIDDASLRAVWRRTDGGWRVQTSRFTLRNADARASGMLTLELPADGTSPRLQLLGLVEDGRATATGHYLPLSVSEGLREWLTRALAGGTLRRGAFLFDGPLRREPALLAQRTFQMRFQADGLTLAFLPGWPALTAADGDVLVSAGRVVATGRSGRLLDSLLGDIAVTVTPREDRPAQLQVNAHVDGDLGDTFRLFRETPLNKVVPAELLRWEGAGRLGANVQVSMPLGGAESPRVTVAGDVAGGTLSSAAHALEVSDVSGALRFDTVDGFSARDLRGRSLGSELTGSARTTAVDGRAQTVVDLRGRLRMQPVNAWLKIPVLDVLRGDADAAVTLRFGVGQSGATLLEVRSDLRGIASAAPVPLAKSADASVDTRFSYTLGTDTPRLTLQSGRALAADVSLRAGTPTGGAIALGSARLPVVGEGKGLVIEGSAPALSIPDWLAFIGRMTGGPAVAPAQGVSLSRAIAGIAALGDTLQRVNVTADRMDAGLLPLESASLSMWRESAGWIVRIDSRSVDGQAVLPDGYQQRGEKPLVVQLDSLDLPAAQAAMLGGNAGLAPADVPRMALALNNIRVAGEDYGSWSLETVPEGTGVALRDVHGAWRALDIQGQGNWSPAPEGGTRTRFTGTAKADDLARVSEAFDVEANLSSAAATARVDLGWSGRPIDVDPLKVKGTLALDLRDGRFVTTSARTQALRAFGVFNIGTWQRRMKLDFTDLYKKGVAFDTLSGDVAIDAGRLATENLVVKGPSAVFELSGSTDLGTHALDNRVRVTLPVNSNLYVGCLAGLAACAGIVAVEQLWGDRLEKMTTLVYEVDGTWEDPLVKQVEGAPAPRGK